MFEMWDDAWTLLKVKAESKKWKLSKQEAELDPNSQEAKWMREWEILMDLILDTTSTNEAEIEGEEIKYGEYRNEALDQMRFFIHPQHRRHSLKWVQSTKETDILFLAYKMTDDLHEIMYRAIYPDIPMGKNYGQKDEKSFNETFRCFMTTPSMTTSLQVKSTFLSFTSTISPQFAQKSTPPEHSRKKCF